MNCRSAESLFSSHIEDEISQEERRNLEAHLLGCRRCSVAMRDVRATMSILQKATPLVAPGAHFDEDVYARIRSGEGLRPTAAELIRDLLSPARLRPLYLAGAGACVVAAALVFSPVGRNLLHPVPALVSASRTQAPASGVTAAPPAASGASSSAPIVAERTAPAPGGASSGRAGSVIASAPKAGSAVRDSIVDSGMPQQRYNDEIINDQFYLERGQQGQDPSVVPVNQTRDDGVYIVF